MIRQIRKFNDPILSTECKPAPLFRCQRIATDLIDTLKDTKNAVGIAAPQIGEDARVIVVKLGSEPVAMIDPRIVHSAGSTTVPEGCLSYPGVMADVRRAKKISIEYKDEYGKGPLSRKFRGFDAVVIQHEIDHLNGVCRVGDEWRRQNPLAIPISEP